MSIHLSRAEYWLLDVAVKDSVPIADLINGDAAGSLNRSDHQCSPEELADGLERLFADRLIKSYPQSHRRRYRFLRRQEIEWEMRRPKLPPVGDEIMKLSPRHPDEAFYQLTPTGGAAWESFARPDWTRFLEGVGTTIERGQHQEPPYRCRGYVICPTPRWLELYLRLASHIGHVIESDTVRRDIVSPWKATYWKTLPQAHRARYFLTYHSVYAENLGWTDAATNTFQLFRSWYRWQS